MNPTADESLSPKSLSRRAFITTTGAVAALAAEAGALAAEAAAPPAPSGDVPIKPAERESLKEAKTAVKAVERTIAKISREVWDLPAVGLKEQEAMEVHIRELEAAGFKIVSRKSGGHPTAFVAEWSLGTGGPKLGFLPEYDALPGLGNAAEAKLKPAPNGKTDGHACGHNCLGAGCTGAAIPPQGHDGEASDARLAARVWMRRRGEFRSQDFHSQGRAL